MTWGGFIAVSAGQPCIRIRSWYRSEWERLVEMAAARAPKSSGRRWYTSQARGKDQDKAEVSDLGIFEMGLDLQF